MFYGCTNLTTIPQLNTSKVTTITSMFYECTNLTTIPQLDISNVTGMGNTFYKCSKLKSILMYGMKVNFDISASTQFEREDLVTILNNLGTVTSTQTLTMGSTNLAKLTDEDKLIATNKNWTLA
jgi:surface protein